MLMMPIQKTYDIREQPLQMKYFFQNFRIYTSKLIFTLVTAVGACDPFDKTFGYRKIP